MENELLKDKVGELSKAIVNTLLDHYTKDEGTKNAATSFVKSIIDDKKTEESVITLVNEVLSSPEFTKHATKVAQHVTYEIINDPDILSEITTLFGKVIEKTETKK